jgi:cyanophycinase
MNGVLIPIGGAEDKSGQGNILASFVDLCGDQARVAIIPAASSMPQQVGEQYRTLFTQLGAAVEVISIETRAEANDSARAAVLAGCTGVFLSGGDQVKLVSLLGGTQVADALQQLFKRGGIIAGTSAGASALSQHMIAFGRSGGAPAQRMVQLAPGLGLAQGVIIDQHFRQRDRIGRLMTAVAYNPVMIGIGLDENTALVIDPGGRCEVIGTGSVTVIDGSRLSYTNIHTAKAHDPITVSGAYIHFLTAGCGYDLYRRAAWFPDLAAESNR